MPGNNTGKAVRPPPPPPGLDGTHGPVMPIPVMPERGAPSVTSYASSGNRANRPWNDFVSAMKSLGRNHSESPAEPEVGISRAATLRSNFNHNQNLEFPKASLLHKRDRADPSQSQNPEDEGDKENAGPGVPAQKPYEMGTVSRGALPSRQVTSRSRRRQAIKLADGVYIPVSRSSIAHSLNSVPTVETVERVAAAKFYLESYFDNVAHRTEIRERFRMYMENELGSAEHLTANQKVLIRMLFNQEWAWHLRETRFLEAASSKATRGLSASPIVDNYEQIRILGKGSFGVVKLVREKGPLASANQVYAMKVIRKANMLVFGQEGNLRAERDLLISAQSSNWIVPLVASFQDSSNLYLVMDYMPGGDFFTVLEKYGSLNELTTRFYIAEMVLCIEEAHKLNCIHRDIKPDNFLISASGHLKISDFGLAFDGHWSHDGSYYSAHRYSVLGRIKMEPKDERLVQGVEDDNFHRHRRWLRSVEHGMKRHCGFNNSSESLLEWRDKHGKRGSVNSIVGTSQYMAPEVVRGDRYDGRCDWWSLGIILFECLFGYTPFHSPSGGRSATRKNILNHEQTLTLPDTIISSRCKDLVMSLLKEPEQRITAQAYQRKTKSKGSKGPYLFVVHDDADEIKNHPWFRSIPWDNLHRVTPPFVPKIQSPDDCRYFRSPGKLSDWSQTEEESDESEELGPMTRDLVRRLLRTPATLSEVAAQLTTRPYDNRAMQMAYEEIEKSRFQEADKNTLKMYLAQNAPEEKRRPRDLLLRARETKAQSMAIRKEVAFMGYTWRRRRVYDYDTLPQVPGGNGVPQVLRSTNGVYGFGEAKETLPATKPESPAIKSVIESSQSGTPESSASSVI